jgi:Predicted nuclease of the RecB family
MFGVINYEDEIGYKIVEYLKYRFNIEDERILFRYFYLRFLTYDIDNRINWFKKNSVIELEKKRLFIDFLISELNLCYIDNKLYYGEIEVQRIASTSNCLVNIVDDWEFQSSLYPIKDSQGIEYSFDKILESQWKSICKIAKNKAKKYKKDKFYGYYLKYFCLMALNELYGVNKDDIKVPLTIDGFVYPELNENHYITLEHECERYIHVSRLRSDNVEMITEKDLEDFLVKRLELIEQGLRFIERQVILENGRLDILAKDINGDYVIIELKVVEDKDLLWQVVVYPTQFKAKYNTDNVRVITLCPNYPEHMKMALSFNSFVEMIEFKPVIDSGKLIDLKTNKIA